MRKRGILIVAGILAILGFGAYYGVNSAIQTKAIVFDEPLTLNVTKTWVDPEGKKTYYLVAGKDSEGNIRVIEIESPLGNIFASNPDNDWARIEPGNVYDFKCTGWENPVTRDNLVCKLA